jgi:hypothetical protein
MRQKSSISSIAYRDLGIWIRKHAMTIQKSFLESNLQKRFLGAVSCSYDLPVEAVPEREQDLNYSFEFNRLTQREALA